LKILIVEDEFISRTLLRGMLAPFGNCHVAVNGKEAIDVIGRSYEESATKYDLVCLDIMMPEMSGHEVLTEVRRIERLKGLEEGDTIKVLMVSSLDDSKNINEAFEVGRCQGYLTKPISRIKLQEQLSNLRLIDTVSEQQDP